MIDENDLLADEEMEAENLLIWNQVSKTDPKYTKEFKGKGGFNGTAVCAQYQMLQATKLWGPFGEEWGVNNVEYTLEQRSDDQRNAVLVYSATLYYPKTKGGELKASQYITAEIDTWTYSKKYDTWSKNNDCRKKTATDALTKGLSKLGFAADIFMGMYDDNTYVQTMNKAHSPNSVWTSRMVYLAETDNWQAIKEDREKMVADGVDIDDMRALWYSLDSGTQQKIRLLTDYAKESYGLSVDDYKVVKEQAKKDGKTIGEYVKEKKLAKKTRKPPGKTNPTTDKSGDSGKAQSNPESKG